MCRLYTEVNFESFVQLLQKNIYIGPRDHPHSV